MAGQMFNIFKRTKRIIMVEKKIRIETFMTDKALVDYMNAAKLKKDDVIFIAFRNEEIVLIYMK